MSRILLSVLLSLVLSAPAVAQFGPPVQTRTACSSGCNVTDDFGDSSITVTGLTGLTVGNCVAVVGMHGHTTRTFNAPTDGGGNTYTEAVENPDGVQGNVVISFARVATTTTTLTLTTSGATTDENYVAVMEFAGCANPLALDPVNSADTASATTHAAGNVTTTVANALLIGAAKCTAGTLTTDAAFAGTPVNISRHLIAYDTLTSTTTQGFTITSADPEFCAVAIASLRGAAGGGPAGSRNNRRFGMLP